MLTLSSVCSYLVNEYILVPLGVEYLRTIAFILVIAVVVQFTEMVMHKTSPLLYQVLGIFLPLITTNCAVLGVALLNIQEQHGFVESAFYGFGAAVGFSLVLVLFAAVREARRGGRCARTLPGQCDRTGHRRPDVDGVHGLRRPGQRLNGT